MAGGMGVYRMWRDDGYGGGAILIGLAMDFVAVEAAFYRTGILVVVSGGIVFFWMAETNPAFGTREPPAAGTQQAVSPATEES